MVEAYPRTLRRTAASADLAEGQVLHSLGRHEEAATRFAAAAETAEAFGTPATRDLACVCGALTELSDGSPQARSRALNLVRPVVARHEAMNAEAAAGGEGRVGGSQLRAPGGGAIRHGVRHLAAGRGGAGGKAQAVARAQTRAQPVLQPPARRAVPEPHRDHCAGHPRRRSEPIPGHAAELVHA